MVNNGNNNKSGWWFGTWILYFSWIVWLSIQLGMSSSQLTNIFQMGWNMLKPPTRYDIRDVRVRQKTCQEKRPNLEQMSEFIPEKNQNKVPAFLSAPLYYGEGSLWSHVENCVSFIFVFFIDQVILKLCLYFLCLFNSKLPTHSTMLRYIYLHRWKLPNNASS